MNAPAQPSLQRGRDVRNFDIAVLVTVALYALADLAHRCAWVTP